MKLSIVTTLYRSADHLVEFVERMRRSADTLAVEYEIVMVNDGSPDDSLRIGVELVAADQRIRLVDLARRYGHYEAMLAGLRHAKGARVFLIDSDLEESPELLPQLWRVMDEDEECDLAIACQEKRRGRSMSELGGALFYRMLRIQTGLDIPRDNLVARLMSRTYVDALVSSNENPVSFDALSARIGFRIRTVATVKESRGSTTYSLGRRTAIFVDSMLAYGSGVTVVFFLLALSIAAAGLWALTCYERAFPFVILAALVAGLVGVGIVVRSLFLILEEIRYRPAQVRRLYPDV